VTVWIRASAIGAALALGACGSNTKAVEGDPFVAAFRVVRPSVVLFTMKIPSDDPKKKGQWDDAYGTGVIVASGNWGTQILTVEHVIEDAHNLHATIGEKTIVPATVVARDKKSDLALVETSKPNLPVATLSTAVGVEPGLRSASPDFRSPTPSPTRGWASRLQSMPAAFRASERARSNSTSRSSGGKRRSRLRRPHRRRHRPCRIALRGRESDRLRDPIDDAEAFLKSKLHPARPPPPP